MSQTKIKKELIDASFGTDWQSTLKTADFTAVSGEGYFVDTTSAAITVTLPSSPSAGDEVSIVDYAGTADTNNITITSSDNINGTSDDVFINYERGGVSMVYVDATQGWIAYNATNETATALKPPAPLTVDYLVVAGGGSGGCNYGGGGGAGGYRNSYNNESSGGGGLSESSLSLSTLTNYALTVGGGGATSTVSNTYGNDGSNSVFSTITSIGGGGGVYSNPSPGNTGNGGSGGGSRYSNSPGSGTANQGYSGGAGTLSGSPYAQGGGGGAGSVGQAGSGSKNGDGGSGLASTITGSSITRAGGGGGGFSSDFSIPGGAGGSGGGGAGGNSSSANGSPGTPNTGSGGGGGGGGNSGDGGSGGSGVVILRYPSAYTINETTSSQLTFTTATDGSDKVTTFTGGDGTIEFTT